MIEILVEDILPWTAEALVHGGRLCVNQSEWPEEGSPVRSEVNPT